MKKIYLIVLVPFISTFVNAQQLTRYTNYLSNEHLINPAFTGGLTYNPIQFTYRKQWVGFNGSPETYTIGGHGAINKKMGIGAIVYKDNMGGAISQTGVIVNYAYRLNLTEKSKLAFGLGISLNQFSLNTSKIVTAEQNDPSMQDGIQKSTVPDVNFGVLYSFDDYFKFGFCAEQIIQTKLKNLDNYGSQDSRLIRHYNTFVSRKINLNEEFNIEPSLLVKFTEVTKLQADLNLRGWYKKMLMLGLTYRHMDALAILAGVKYNRIFLAYSYDVGLSAFSNYNNGSHEIILGFYFENKNR